MEGSPDGREEQFPALTETNLQRTGMRSRGLLSNVKGRDIDDPLGLVDGLERSHTAKQTDFHQGRNHGWYFELVGQLKPLRIELCQMLRELQKNIDALFKIIGFFSERKNRYWADLESELLRLAGAEAVELSGEGVGQLPELVQRDKRSANVAGLSGVFR